MTNAEKRAVVERIGTADMDGGAGWCLHGVMNNSGGVAVTSPGEPWRVWPGETAFVAYARARGLESIVHMHLGVPDEDTATPFVVVRFPDGTVMAKPFQERQWPSLEAFEQDTCTRPRHVVRWHPAPEGAEELAQASTVMEAVKVLARKLAEHGLLPDDPELTPFPPEATDGLAKAWTEEAFRILRKRARAVTPAEPEMKEGRDE